MAHSNQEIAAMLNDDMRGEHMAIVQYLLHAYAMGEGEIPCEIEEIARDEMRHYRWLAETIVELGGSPTIDRNQLYRTEDVVQNMLLDVKAEDDAIALYNQHLAAIQDPKIVRLLERIVSDEQAHREKFVGFANKFKAMPAAEAEGAAAAPDANLSSMFDTAIQHEYTVVLQYLYHSFLTPGCEVGKELEMQAINEMQHIGWLAEEFAGVGGTVELEHTEVDLSTDTAKMLEADIHAERAVTEEYTSQIAQIQDPSLKSVVTRIRDNEIYHDKLFTGMLDALRRPEGLKAAASKTTQPPKASRGTVGSLIEDKQS